MIVLVDMDGPLCNFEKKFLEVWILRYPNLSYVPLEERRGFSIVDNYPSEFKDSVQEIYLEDYFAADLEPTTGALEAIYEMLGLGIEVFICSSPMGRSKTNAADKVNWIRKHFGQDFTNNLILTSDKTLVRGDILIDDKPNITGTVKPTWQHIIYKLPQNSEYWQSRRILNWDNWQAVILGN